MKDFKTYLIVEKNFSKHTARAYYSDILSYILWRILLKFCKIFLKKLQKGVDKSFPMLYNAKCRVKAMASLSVLSVQRCYFYFIEAFKKFISYFKEDHRYVIC